MTPLGDPVAEIREFIKRANAVSISDCDTALAALGRLEREAAEREADYQGAIREREIAVGAMRKRVREVEAERDNEAAISAGRGKREIHWRERCEAAEATVARQAETLRTIAKTSSSPHSVRLAYDGLADTDADLPTRAELLEARRAILAYCDSCDEHGGLPLTSKLRAVLASPEAAATEPVTVIPESQESGIPESEPAALPAVDAASQDRGWPAGGPSGDESASPDVPAVDAAPPERSHE